MHKTSIFIEKARAKHGDRYDYSKVVYVRSLDKVIITCLKHGDFEQSAGSHLSGRGCAKCAGLHNYSTAEWISKADAVHSRTYIYSKVDYSRKDGKVIIICKLHGEFKQRAGSHIKGAGCPACGVRKRTRSKIVRVGDRFLADATAKHGNRYDYSKVEYIDSETKITIICKVHGEFRQIPRSHISGCGCAQCGIGNRSEYMSAIASERFVGNANFTHGNVYDYSKTKYIRSRFKVIITCAYHGDFEQTPNNHLNGKGCPRCPKSNVDPNDPACIYLMHDGLGKIKIGYSVNAERRLSELNSKAPFKAEIIETWMLDNTPAARTVEGCIHRKLSKYNAGLSGFDGATEWFCLSHARARKAVLEALHNKNVISHNVAGDMQLKLI